MSRTLSAALIAAALGAVIAWEVQGWRDSYPADADVPTRVPEMARAMPRLDPDAGAEGWAATVLARPLFSQSRRPDAAPADPVAHATDSVRLAGVVTGPSGKRAIFSSKDTKPVIAVEGSRIGDFVVRSIEPNHVVVEAESGLRTLKPSFTDAPSAPPAAAAMAAPVPIPTGRHARPAS
jgi:hypothetical protein